MSKSGCAHDDQLGVYLIGKLGVNKIGVNCLGVITSRLGVISVSDEVPPSTTLTTADHAPAKGGKAKLNNPKRHLAMMHRCQINTISYTPSRPLF